MNEKKQTEKLIVKNKKAFFEYEILEKIEAGIQLVGTEVKSLRQGKCNISEGYVIEQKGELYLKNIHISEYSHGNINNHDPKRIRKILVHKKEIEKLIRKLKETGISIVPLRVYFRGSLIKIEIGIGRGKKLYDKRQTMKERDTNRSIDRELKKYR
ncbi:MAG: SsrA-binding protein SmpB [Spirochaetes bacterium]|nr:SsrA-binding protein SmpB [Spirochaetota bacterium]